MLSGSMKNIGDMGKRMNELCQMLNKQIDILDEIIKHANNSVEKAPEGFLRITKSNNTDQYYWKENASISTWKYLKKEKIQLAKQLAQKEYAKKTLDEANKMRKNIMKLLDHYDPNAILTLYEKMPIGKQKLITPYILSEEQYVKKWKEVKRKQLEKYIMKEQPNDKKNDLIFRINSTNMLNPENRKDIDDEKIKLSEIITEKGEYVRSKSEKILADKFCKMNITYIYEHPLFLKGFGYVKPDFTLINKRTKIEYIWEHLGMMDSPEYAEKSIKKIEGYQRNEMFPGQKLLLTYETNDHPINIKIVEDMIKKYLV